MLIIKNFYYHILLLRPLNLLISVFTMIVAAAILNKLSDLKTLILTSSIVALYAGASNALNDSIDHSIDLINRPERPIPSGRVKVENARIISFFLFLIGSLLCLFLSNKAVFIGVVVAVPIMIFYSTHFKRKCIIGNLAVAFILGLAFLFAGASFDNLKPMWIPMILAFGLTLIRELVKDLADVDGDKQMGLHTFPIVFGTKKSVQLIVALCILVGIGSVIPYLIGYYGKGYIISLLIGVLAPLLLVIFLITANPTIYYLTYSSSILKFSTFMGLISIYFGVL